MSSSNPELLERVKVLSEQVLEAGKSLLRYVCPIYNVGERKAPTLLGSGVLLKIGSQHFLLTACHVLDDAEGTLYYEGPEHLEVLEGMSMRSQDRDFAFLQLDEATALNITRYGFLELSDLDASDQAAEGTFYLFTGYPATRSRAKHALKSIGSNPLTILCAPADKKEYVTLGKEEAFHLLVKFQRNRVTGPDGKRQVSPDPHGMSGGGVWRVVDFSRPDNLPAVDPKLVGLCIEQDKQAGVLVAVRISLALEAIRQSVPPLADLIPPAERFKATISEGRA